MKVRLMGTTDEIATAVVDLRLAFDVLEVSKTYPCRGDSELIRVYVEVRVR